MKRTGIISRCDALGSWIVIAQRESGYYTLQLTKESIEPYLYKDATSGKLRHKFEGKTVDFKLKIERNRYVGDFYADISNPLEPIKRIDSHIFIFG